MHVAYAAKWLSRTQSIKMLLVFKNYSYHQYFSVKKDAMSMPSVPEQLGDYRILDPIGAGGMGQVFLAEHVHLRKRYAVKILPDALARDRSV
jgi:serine/threonine protein kinase